MALRALEQGHAVSIVEVVDDLAARSSGSLGGLVLSGVVDRLPLHAILLSVRGPPGPGSRCADRGGGHRARAGPGGRDVVADELLVPSPLHAQTWEVLLGRANFAGAAPLPGGPDGDGRVAIAATVPA